MAGITKLIERQLAGWDLRHRLEELDQRPGRCLEGGVAYGPCLLISRECGSGGSRIAQMLSERLGWHVFDREILDEIAQLAHVRLQLFASIDEETRLAWGDRWQPELEPEDIGCENYVRYLRQVVLTLGHHGDVIILGRGAQYVLPSQCSLRVRVVAPLEVRAQRVAEADKVTLEQAYRCVQQFDISRMAFVRKTFQRDAAAPLNYDLVINTAEISPEAAVEMIMVGLKSKLSVQVPRRLQVAAVSG